jgi:hypothetical protein
VTDRPPLPAEAPAAVVDFLDGRVDTLDLADGEVDWLPVPHLLHRIAGRLATPRVRIRPGPAGAGDVSVGWGPVALGVRLAVADDGLQVSFPGLPNPLLRPLHGDVRRWVAQADAHLRTRGRRVTAVEVEPGRARLRSGPA